MVLPLLLAVALQGQPGQPPELTRGVNVTRWFCYLGPGDQHDHFRSYLVDADYRWFKRLGVQFVRLCISPDVIYAKGEPVSGALADVDAAIRQATTHGLKVVWDLHDNGQLKLDTDGGDKPGFVHFWQKVAEHYANRYPRQVVFELLNEPQFTKNPADWYRLQKEAVAAIRKADPGRTVMVSGTSWSSIDTLVSMEPLPESNLIYTFHCYDPFFFTHQGAEWAGEYPSKFSQIPFPSSPEAVAKILPLNDEKYRSTLIDYGAKHYDEAYLEARLSAPHAWGRAHHVPVVLGEFGAYPKVSPPEGRANWFKAMRQAIEAFKTPNAIWGYDDALGLGRTVGPDGSVHLDPVTLKNFFRDSGSPEQASSER